MLNQGQSQDFFQFEGLYVQATSSTRMLNEAFLVDRCIGSSNLDTNTQPEARKISIVFCVGFLS